MSLSSSIDDFRLSFSVRQNFRQSIRRKLKRRAFSKNGHCFVVDSSKKSTRFVENIFTGLVQTKLKWTLLTFLMTLLTSWLIFAVLWWLICYTHEDLQPNHLPPDQKKNNFTPCIREVYGFMSCFLFSIETQHTVGYGIRATTEECPEAIFLNAFQCVFGTVIQGIMSGIVFAKMMLPRKRAKTVLFSKKAVVTLRGGFHYLMFRVGDLRFDHVIDVKVKAFMVRTMRTVEGEVLKLHQTSLEVQVDGCGDEDVFLLWPVVVAHRIDEKSPLYDLTWRNLRDNGFEIVSVLEGNIESTGQAMQARSSYLPTEILWGYRFEPLLKFNRDYSEYVADYSKFDRVLPVSNMPSCSARELRCSAGSDEGRMVMK